MFKTRKALIDHLKQAEVPAPVKDVQRYAGQFNQAKKGVLRIPKLEIPAILVFWMDGPPLSRVPEHSISIFFVTATEYLDKDASEEDGLKLCADYADWLKENKKWEDETSYYHLWDPDNSRAQVLFNDHKHTIIELPVKVRVDRE